MGQGEAAEQPTEELTGEPGQAAEAAASVAEQTRDAGSEAASPAATVSWSSTSAAWGQRQPDQLMSDLIVAGADRPAPVAQPTAAELAARIPVPTRLPERYDGEPLRHLSPSSYALWVSCPEFCARAGGC